MFGPRLHDEQLWCSCTLSAFSSLSLEQIYLQYDGDKLVVMFRDRDFGQASCLIHMQGSFKVQYLALIVGVPSEAGDANLSSEGRGQVPS